MAKQLERIRTTFAEQTAWRMVKAVDPANMVSLSSLASAVRLNEIREDLIRQGKNVPSYTAIVLKAAALVMQRYPDANRAILGPPFFRRLYQFHNVDVCVAVEKSLPALPGQPYAGLIRNPLSKNLATVTNELQQLRACTEATDRNFKLFMTILKKVPSPFSLLLINAPYFWPSLWVKFRGCAAWVNSPAKAGADLVVTCWPWPLTFSFGHVKKRPLVVDDKVDAVLTIPLLMSFDRRIMGGGPASRVFAGFIDIIESADSELFRE